MDALADYTHPQVKAKAKELAAGQSTMRGKLQRIFLYVRDDIAFAFPPEGDFVPASKTISTKRGQCNTKATLFLALCKAAGIPARIHFSLIRREIQHGPFQGLPYRLLPDKISHSWIEVDIDGKVHRIDSFINDIEFHKGAVAEIRRRGWETGFSVTRAGGEPTAELYLDDEHFTQMGAVTDDHGLWEDPAEYYASSLYRNRPSRWKQLAYRWAIRGANRRVDAVRRAARDSTVTTIPVSFTRAYLLPCDGGYLLVDTSYEGRFEEFVRKLNREGIEISEIKYLFLTHHHDDHSGLVRELRAANDHLTLITHERSLPALKSGEPDPGDRPLNRCVGVLVFLFNQLFKEKRDWSFPPVDVREGDRVITVDDHELLPSIGVDGKILHTPGHTDDSISIVLSDGRAFVGDLAMDLLSFCGCRYRPIYVTDLDEVFESWQKILDHGATEIYSSHAKKPFSAGELSESMRKLGVRARRQRGGKERSRPLEASP